MTGCAFDGFARAESIAVSNTGEDVPRHIRVRAMILATRLFKEAGVLQPVASCKKIVRTSAGSSHANYALLVNPPARPCCPWKPAVWAHHARLIWNG
jgi:hypothetical protein